LFRAAPELVRRHPRIKFLLVGDGEWRAKFENMARALGLEKQFIFTGLIPPEQVSRYVGVMDALAHLSLREGLPRALPQALAAGKPVVAYDCDGAREVCLDDQTGFLLQPGDTNGLTDKLSLLADNAALRERLGQSGREFVRQNFSVERMVNELESLYLKLASDRRNGQHG
jgi:glycosyltransferase involved in cell wall biosynthesis